MYLLSAPLVCLGLAGLLGEMIPHVRFLMAPKLSASGTVTTRHWERQGGSGIYRVTVRLADGRSSRLGNTYVQRDVPEKGQTLALRCTPQANCRDASSGEPYGQIIWLLLPLLVFGAFIVLWPGLVWRAWRAEQGG